MKHSGNPIIRLIYRPKRNLKEQRQLQVVIIQNVLQRRLFKSIDMSIMSTNTGRQTQRAERGNTEERGRRWTNNHCRIFRMLHCLGLLNSKFYHLQQGRWLAAMYNMHGRNQPRKPKQAHLVPMPTRLSQRVRNRTNAIKLQSVPELSPTSQPIARIR